MGSLISRFKKEKTSLQLLENLQEEIETIECDKHSTVLKQKKVVGKLLVYSVGAYLLFALTVYFLAFPSSLRDGAIYAAPLVFIPFIVLVAQKVIKWYFSRKITWNTEKLADLRARKKKILDEVMDKETFRVAREILEKFAPDQLRKSDGSQSKLSLSGKKGSPGKADGLEKPKAVVKPVETVDASSKPPAPQQSGLGASRPALPYMIQPQLGGVSNTPSSTHQSLLPQATVLSPSQKRRLARPILDPVNSRGFIDRLIEHLVGDGPSNRYALICSNCSSHNGMALKEEFQYISFRCAYCGFPNPSRKVLSKRNSSVSVQSEELQIDGGEKVEETSEAELSAESHEDATREDKDEAEVDELEEPENEEPSDQTVNEERKEEQVAKKQPQEAN